MKKLFLMLAFSGIVGAASANTLSVLSSAPCVSVVKCDKDKEKKKDKKKSCCSNDKSKTCTKAEGKSCCKKGATTPAPAPAPSK